MSSEFKVFRDPIYNLITFHKEKDSLLLRLIDTPEFQRLKRIKQLGLSFYTYPSSVHDRFSHSIGVAHLLNLILSKLDTSSIDSVILLDKSTNEVELSMDEFKLVIKVAALLHDIGHGPFSHAFEKVMKTSHEEFSKGIISNSNSNIYKILKDTGNDKLDDNIIHWVSEIIDKTFSIYWGRDLITSQLDVDRMDYLLRDAYMCGVKYVSFDWQWILSNMKIGKIPQEQNRLGLIIDAQKGIYSLESFIISRYHMYEQVYFHKTTRGVERLFVKILERVQELLNWGAKGLFKEDDYLYLYLQNQNVDSYLMLDDYIIFYHINLWSRYTEDEILRTLCDCFINRKLFKMIKETDGQLIPPEKYSEIASIFGHNDYFRYYLIDDDYINNPYKDNYLLGKESSENAEHIWLLNDNNRLVELAESSRIVHNLKTISKKVFRLYCLRTYSDQVKRVLT